MCGLVPQVVVRVGAAPYTVDAGGESGHADALVGR